MKKKETNTSHSILKFYIFMSHKRAKHFMTINFNYN